MEFREARYATRFFCNIWTLRAIMYVPSLLLRVSSSFLLLTLSRNGVLWGFNLRIVGVLRWALFKPVRAFFKTAYAFLKQFVPHFSDFDLCASL